MDRESIGSDLRGIMQQVSLCEAAVFSLRSEHLGAYAQGTLPAVLGQVEMDLQNLIQKLKGGINGRNQQRS